MWGGYCSLPGPRGVDADLAQIEGVRGLEAEVDEVIGGHPVAQVGREQERGRGPWERSGRPCGSRLARRAPVQSACKQTAFPKSDRLLVRRLAAGDTV